MLLAGGLRHPACLATGGERGFDYILKLAQECLEPRRILKSFIEHSRCVFRMQLVSGLDSLGGRWYFGDVFHPFATLFFAHPAKAVHIAADDRQCTAEVEPELARCFAVALLQSVATVIQSQANIGGRSNLTHSLGRKHILLIVDTATRHVLPVCTRKSALKDHRPGCGPVRCNIGQLACKPPSQCSAVQQNSVTIRHREPLPVVAIYFTSGHS